MSATAVLRALRTDITTLAVDAIVNAANETLLGGGGVDGAIHRAAGPGLLAECRALPQSRPGVRCPTGEARITAGHGLKARWVIHTVGPVWRGGDRGEPELLAACYRNVLALAGVHAVRSLAMPAISCGIYGYPLQEAADIAVHTTRFGLQDLPALREVVFACFATDALAAYRALLEPAA
ncbi:MAG: O-acetyl-ADP-ribose deacetylase [Nevskia sp.]|nr:O-acetyl-ADP-ribose deacetylase [Nevskia sp.]